MKNMLKTLLNAIKVFVKSSMPKKLSDLKNDISLSSFNNDMRLSDFKNDLPPEEPELFVITVDKSNYIPDCTYEDVAKAYESGKHILLKLNETDELGSYTHWAELGSFSSNTFSFIYISGELEERYQFSNISSSLQRYTTLYSDSFMGKTNPFGTGKFMMNAKTGGTMGGLSTAIGEGTFSEYKNQFTEGMYNKYDTDNYGEDIGRGNTLESVSSAKFYYGYEYSFSKTNGQYTIVNQKSDYIYNIPVGAYFKPTTASSLYMYYRTPEAQLTVPSSNRYSLTDVIVYHGKRLYECKKYAKVIGNGTSDTDRSNAHTLDWQGNAEYAGDVKANACGGEEPISLVETWKKANEAGGGVFVVNITDNGDGTGSADKTFEEIKNAHERGMIVKAYTEDTGYMSVRYADSFTFSFIDVKSSSGLTESTYITIYDNNEVEIIYKEFDVFECENTRLNTTNKTFIGAINELYAEIQALKG